MPATSRASTSCQRFSWVEPGAFVWASSSTSASCGARASTASRSSSSSATPRWTIARRGTTSRSPTSAEVARRPWVSTTATTTSTPSARSRAPSSSIVYVLPTPGAAPSTTRNRPRFMGSACHPRGPDRAGRGHSPGTRERPVTTGATRRVSREDRAPSVVQLEGRTRRDPARSHRGLCAWCLSRPSDPNRTLEGYAISRLRCPMGMEILRKSRHHGPMQQTPARGDLTRFATEAVGGRDEKRRRRAAGSPTRPSAWRPREASTVSSSRT